MLIIRPAKINHALEGSYSDEEAPEGCAEILRKIADFCPSEKLPMSELLYRSGVIVGVFMSGVVEEWGESCEYMSGYRGDSSLSTHAKHLTRGMKQAHYYALDTGDEVRPTHKDLREDIKEYLTMIYEWLERGHEGEAIDFTLRWDNVTKE